MRPYRALIGKLYDHVSIALWVSLCIFVGYFFVFIAPGIPVASQRAEMGWQLELNADAHRYCEKWGLKAGTHEHTLCTMDVQEIRKKATAHLAESIDF